MSLLPTATITTSRGRLLAIALAVLSPVGCKQPLVVGEYQCPVTLQDGGAEPKTTDPIGVPWSMGFENQLECDFKAVGGYCYGVPSLTARVVTQPVHSGDFSGEFTIETDRGEPEPQARCVREGVFPTEAYYGAWYYFPTLVTKMDNWNLFHFTAAGIRHPLWDVSVGNDTPGEMNLRIFGFLPRSPSGKGPTLPVGKWVHIVFYWKRAEDATGAVALYQDGVRVLNFTNLVTTDSDSGQGRWFVGNLANSLTPQRATVYIDDVTIRSTP